MRIGYKAWLVLGMTLLILVPLMLIRGTIRERQMYRNEAVASVARSYAGEQTFVGPVLVVPYVETVEVEEKDAQGNSRKVLRERPGQWTFFPATLDVGGRIKPGTRNRGLHEVRVYAWQATAAARFEANVPDDSDALQPRRIGRPWLGYGVADVRGLIGSPRLRVNGVDAVLEQGLGSRDSAGVHTRLAAPGAGSRIVLSARFDFILGGTESLAVVPLARRNRVTLDSSWQHPHFGGSFLPGTRTIGANGFRAEWDVSSLATNAQAQYRAGGTTGSADAPVSPSGRVSDGANCLDSIRVSLVDPVNVYSQADRASKYGLLFVSLTFVGFFMFELVKSLPIHPVQYGLVGLALALFFLLLLGLSEHIAFGWAYLAAGTACIGLLGYYMRHVLRSRSGGLGFATMLAALYAALYGLLTSEDNALVLGAVLLFVILAAMMVATRKLDWYQLGRGVGEA
jgi:inner membrane protein